MKITARLLSIGLVGCATAAFLVHRSLREPAPGPPTLPFEKASSSQAQKEPVARTESGMGDIAALKQEVSRIDSEISSLRQQLFSLSTDIKKNAQHAESESLAGEGKKKAVDMEHQKENADKAHQARLDALESSFRNEREDPRWSSATLSMLQSTVNNDEGLRASTRHIECRSKTCRVEISDRAPEKVSESIGALMKQAEQTLPSISASQVDEGDGTLTTVLFLSRESTSRPIPH